MSLHKKDWAKLIGGALLVMTGAGAAGVGPLAGMLSSAGSAGAGAAGAAGAAGGAAAAGATGGFGSLVAPSLVSAGLGTATSGAMGTPSEKMTSPVGVPQLQQQEDPFAMFAQLMKKSKGGM